MGETRVSTQDVMDVANTISVCNQEMNSESSILNTAIANLNSQWDGIASERIISNYYAIQKNITVQDSK